MRARRLKLTHSCLFVYLFICSWIRHVRIQLENGSLYISSVEENRGLTGAYQCLLSSDGVGTIVSRSAVVSISSE